MAPDPGSRTDPFRAYNFKVEIQGIVHAHFTQCSSLQASVHSIAYRAAGSGLVVHQVPGLTEYAPVTLRYGLTASAELFQWFQAVAAGNVDRRNVSILLLDSASTGEVRRWNLRDAWPSQWQGAPLDALGRELAVESMTLVHEGFELG